MKENMETLEALDSIEKRLEATCLSKCGHGWNENCICGNNFCGKIERIRKDLELLELIHDKQIDINWILSRPCNKAYDYNGVCDIELTADEFNRIKEWLKR